MIKKMCLHQFIRPLIYVSREGYGNCTVCVPDEKNRDCFGYTPITFYVIEVANEKKEEQEVSR